MQALIDRCRRHRFIATLDASTQHALFEAGAWFSAPGGARLFAAGDPASAVYFVLSGRLIVVRETDGEDEVVGYVRAGEPVGEMALLAGDRHSASAYALRDTEVLAVPADLALRLFAEASDFASKLGRTMLRRIREPHAGADSGAPRVFALVGASPSIDVEAAAETLEDLIARLGRRVCICRGDDPEAAIRSFETKENEHDVVLAPCRVGENAWYRFALRHADRFVVFTRRDSRPPRPFPLSPSDYSAARRFRLVDLVVVEEGRDAGAATAWAAAARPARIFRWGGADDRTRLARAIAGRSVALVLSGGGARAYAHLGAVRAIRERGLPIDFVAGASMGGVIAACLAIGWDDAETEARIRDAFVSSNPLGDHVLPVVAMTRGRRVEARLAAHFGDERIEDLKRPFYCVSSELTRGVLRVHRDGLVREALRASVSLPGVLPPVVDGSDLLVDGAVIDNFPVGVMTRLHRGLTIGVDVARRGSIAVDPYRDPPSFARWIRRHGFSAAPPIVALLMRAATARRAVDRDAERPDVLIEPTAPGVEIRDWKRIDEAIADGYEAAVAALEKSGPLVNLYKI